MKSKKTFVLFAMLGVILALQSFSSATMTVATFNDPSGTASDPLFILDLDPAAMEIRAGWDQPGLSLKVYTSATTFVTYDNVLFTMSDVDVTLNYVMGFGQQTGGGTIKFIADADRNLANPTPLVQIDFLAAYVSFSGMGGSDYMTANGVSITGSAVNGALTNETFSFSFANPSPLSGDFMDWSEGATSTASFTSSAIPEPATLAMLAIGGLPLLRRKMR